MLKKAPECFSSFANAPVPFGLYAGPVADVSTAPWRSLRRTCRKAWLYAGAFSDPYYTGFAIADAGIVATAFAYVFDTRSGKYTEEKTTVPFGFGASFDPDLKTAWKLKGFSVIPDGGDLICRYHGRHLDLKITVTENGMGATTIAPAGSRPFHHTYKNLLLPARIEAKADGRSIKFAGNIGGIDFSKGYPPRHTYWNWASMNAVTEDGTGFAVNLVGDFNNSIENALWLNGEVSHLSQATFSYGKPAGKSIWHINTLDGLLSMQFHPLGMRGEDINAGLMLSRFKQPFGVFKGIVKIAGQERAFTGCGVVEEHFAVW